jgi:hypothetical protein
MDWTAVVVSMVVTDPAKSPIACDAKAAPEKAPAAFGFVQLPAIGMIGTVPTGAAVDTAAGQNTLCALADPVERRDAPMASPSADIAPTRLTRGMFFMRAAQGKSPERDYSMAVEVNLCSFYHTIDGNEAE